MDKVSVRIRKKLNVNSLNELLKNNFAKIKDNRDDNNSIELTDILMSAYAMFSLKPLSLLSFRNKFSEDKKNLESVFKTSKVPSDNEMRQVIDEIDPRTHKK